jgi:S1-C subfamily serine protease
MKTIFALAFAALLFTGCAAEEINPYERAQRQTVILESDTSYGSGVTVQRRSPEGKTKTFVWTAAHVVSGVNTIKVERVVRHEYQKVGVLYFSARVIARDPDSDLALLYVDGDPKEFTPTFFGGHLFEPVGTSVFHVGNYSGPAYDGSVSTGIVSQLGAKPPGVPWRSTDQTTALVDHGSSGGGLFNKDGFVIGIVIAMVGPGISFYVPMREIDRFAFTKHVQFALRGDICPSGPDIEALAKSALTKAK